MNSSGRLAARWPGDPTQERFLWKLSLSFDTRHTFVLKLSLLLLKRAIPSSQRYHFQVGLAKHTWGRRSTGTTWRAPRPSHTTVFAFLIRTATASSLLYTCHLFKHRKLPNYANTLCEERAIVHTYILLDAETSTQFVSFGVGRNPQDYC